MIRTCCLTGHPDISKAEGNDEKIAGVTCYMTGNDDSKKLIVLLPDVLGNSPHAKTLCDNYSKLGFKVCMIDLFNGAPIPVEVLARMDPLMKLPPNDEVKVRKTIFTKIWNFFHTAFLVISVLPILIPFMFKHARKSKIEEKNKMVLKVTEELAKKNIKILPLLDFVMEDLLLIIYQLKKISHLKHWQVFMDVSL